MEAVAKLGFEHETLGGRRGDEMLKATFEFRLPVVVC